MTPQIGLRRPSDTPPPRLQVIPASEAKVAVILRQGPSKEVACLLWNRQTDEVQLGQWLKGRIHGSCSDLSPDGKHFLYCADDHRMNRRATADTWTAISVPPYLTAIVLHDEARGFTSGGYFVDNRRFWLNSVDQHIDVRSSGLECVRYLREGHGPVRVGETSVALLKQLRWGWSLEDPGNAEKPGTCEVAQALRKTLPGGWVLRKADSSRGRDGKPLAGHGLEPHELCPPDDRPTLHFPEWDWGDWLDDRLVWCAQGHLWTADFDPHNGLAEPRSLYDFCGMKFESRPAPYAGINL
ncbi:hypothetical protein Pan44_54960 [Caulifigura coniformis]|uniref:Translocation protein TolB n=1 Tax=Caulifigura coniformis TaxID=2527983 RepID=A0A517SMS5_9PLAN|nr:hypothetical protein [Caulifigura coniformis]QDT57427.1 hypothetical protein Pan44_54960 [Caulifigura coniformis]